MKWYEFEDGSEGEFDGIVTKTIRSTESRPILPVYPRGTYLLFGQCIITSVPTKIPLVMLHIRGVMLFKVSYTTARMWLQRCMCRLASGCRLLSVATHPAQST